MSTLVICVFFLWITKKIKIVIIVRSYWMSVVFDVILYIKQLLSYIACCIKMTIMTKTKNDACTILWNRLLK